jgi:hypothetical protein
MYYEVIMRNGKSYYFDTEAEADAFIDSPEGEDWGAVYERGEFPDSCKD